MERLTMNNAIIRPDIPDPAERRSDDRRIVDSDSTLRDPYGRPLSVLVRDLSMRGFAAECDRELTIGTIITLGLPGFGSAQAVIVRRHETGYGCQFVEPLAPAAFATAFGTSNVVAAPFRTMLTQPGSLAEPVIETWSTPARMRLIVGGSIALWVLVLTLI